MNYQQFYVPLGLMALFLDLHSLVEMVSIGTILAYTLVTVSVLILRYKAENLGMVRARTLSRLSGISNSYDGTRSINSRHSQEEGEEDEHVENNEHLVENTSESLENEETERNVGEHCFLDCCLTYLLLFIVSFFVKIYIK